LESLVSFALDAGDDVHGIDKILELHSMNSMYWHMSLAFILIKATGNPSKTIAQVPAYYDCQMSHRLRTPARSSTRQRVDGGDTRGRAREVGVHPLITANELIGECETGHQSFFIQKREVKELTKKIPSTAVKAM
jgi:hypothetical protein